MRYPLETGGVLVGYVADNQDVVVRFAIGPGPLAVHRRHRFTPDHAFQCRELDARYAKTQGTEVYVGEWHTHPDGVALLSWLDRRTLACVAQDAGAAIRHPLMMIGAGSPRSWQWGCHQHVDTSLWGTVSRSSERQIREFASELE